MLTLTILKLLYIFNLTALCLNGTRSCVHFMDVIIGDIPFELTQAGNLVVGGGGGLAPGWQTVTWGIYSSGCVRSIDWLRSKEWYGGGGGGGWMGVCSNVGDAGGGLGGGGGWL